MKINKINKKGLLLVKSENAEYNQLEADVDLLHKSHNAPVPYLTMHHFVIYSQMIAK